MTAAVCMIAWVIGDPIGFAVIKVGTEMRVFPIMGWMTFLDLKSP